MIYPSEKMLLKYLNYIQKLVVNASAIILGENSVNCNRKKILDTKLIKI